MNFHEYLIIDPGKYQSPSRTLKFHDPKKFPRHKKNFKLSHPLSHRLFINQVHSHRFLDISHADVVSATMVSLKSIPPLLVKCSVKMSSPLPCVIKMDCDSRLAFLPLRTVAVAWLSSSSTSSSLTWLKSASSPPPSPFKKREPFRLIFNQKE